MPAAAAGSGKGTQRPSAAQVQTTGLQVVASPPHCPLSVPLSGMRCPPQSIPSLWRKSPCEPCSLHVPDLQDDHQVEGGGVWRKTQQHMQHAVQSSQHLQEEQSRCALLLALFLQEAGFNSCHLKQNSATIRCQEPALWCLRVCLGCLLPAAKANWKKRAELAGRLSVAQPALTSSQREASKLICFSCSARKQM